MKIFVHTIRYGIEQSFEYHGNDYYYDSANGVLNIYSPIEEDGTVGIMAICTMTAGDRLLVVSCEPSCSVHTPTVGKSQLSEPVDNSAEFEKLRQERRKMIVTLTEQGEKILGI